MKLLLDEQLSKRVAIALRDGGRAAVSVQEGDLAGSMDREVFEAAEADGRVIVTADVPDFRRLATEWALRGQEHSGIVFLPSRYRRTRRNVGQLVAALDRLVEANPGSDALRGRETWLALPS